MDPRTGPLTLAAVVVAASFVTLVLAGVAAMAGTPEPDPPAAIAPVDPPEPDLDRYWAEEVERLRARPCEPGSGGTAVYLFVGADAHWSAQLSAALEESGSRCTP